MSSPEQTFQKIIWMYWHQGEAAAPALVKLCIQSWVAHNPTWQVRVLDAGSIALHVDVAEALGKHGASLPLQQNSVLLRLSLLSRHGGVWADCTAFCMQALDTWLPAQLRSGFFAFRDPGPDRVLSNWFLAAERGNRLVVQAHRVTRAYFDAQRFPRQDTTLRKRIIRRLGTSFNGSVEATQGWFSWPVHRVLRVYPYFVNHYLFARLLREDPQCRAIWEAGQPVASKPLQALVDYGVDDATHKAIAAIAGGAVPAFKLNLRIDPSRTYWSTVLARLRDSLPRA